MSQIMLENPISVKSPKVWDVPSQKSKYMVLGNQHDDLDFNKMALVRIISKKGHPIIFSAKIRVKKQDNPNNFVKFIQIPQNLIQFFPKEIKKIEIQFFIKEH